MNLDEFDKKEREKLKNEFGKYYDMFKKEDLSDYIRTLYNYYEKNLSLKELEIKKYFNKNIVYYAEGMITKDDFISDELGVDIAENTIIPTKANLGLKEIIQDYMQDLINDNETDEVAEKAEIIKNDDNAIANIIDKINNDDQLWEELYSKIMLYGGF